MVWACLSACDVGGLVRIDGINENILSDFDLPCRTIWKDLTGNGVISQHNNGSKQTYLDRKKRTNMKYKGGRTKYLLQAW